MYIQLVNTPVIENGSPAGNFPIKKSTSLTSQQMVKI